MDWGKILAAVLLLLLVGYIYGRPVLERWVGHPLPAPGEAGSDSQSDDVDSLPQESRSGLPGGNSAGGDRTRGSGAQAGDPESATARQPSGTSRDAQSPRGERARPNHQAGTEGRGIRESGFFERLPGQRFRSPAGLVYGRGPGGEHRIEHVLLHAVDDPPRPVHGVFRGDEAEVFAIIDEAWKLAKKGGRGVQRSTSGDGRTEYTIRLNRPIGYVGGSQGARDNYPNINRVRIVIQNDNEVVTAYPVRAP